MPAELGHRSKKITKKHYIVKRALAPNSSHILEQLGAGPTATGSERRDHGLPGQRTHAQTNT